MTPVILLFHWPQDNITFAFMAKISLQTMVCNITRL